jgi:hypothetical protein
MPRSRSSSSRRTSSTRTNTVRSKYGEDFYNQIGRIGGLASACSRTGKRCEEAAALKAQLGSTGCSRNKRRVSATTMGGSSSSASVRRRSSTGRRKSSTRRRSSSKAKASASYLGHSRSFDNDDWSTYSNRNYRSYFV